MSTELGKRVVTAAALISVLTILFVAVAVFPSMQWLLVVISLVFVFGCAHEFAVFSSATDPSRATASYLAPFCVSALPAAAVGLGVLVTQRPLMLFNYQAIVMVMGGLVASSIIMVSAIVLSARPTLDCASRMAGQLPLALILIGVGGGALVGLSTSPYAIRSLIWFIAVVAVNDIAAYFGGKEFGRTLLAPTVSPKKTVAGALSGILGGMVVAVAGSSVLAGAWSWPGLLAISALIIVAAQSGDLLKSYLKRLNGVKDSGALLPGHGGVLDRLDGFLAAAPLMLAWSVSLAF